MASFGPIRKPVPHFLTGWGVCPPSPALTRAPSWRSSPTCAWDCLYSPLVTSLALQVACQGVSHRLAGMHGPTGTRMSLQVDSHAHGHSLLPVPVSPHLPCVLGLYGSPCPTSLSLTLPSATLPVLECESTRFRPSVLELRWPQLPLPLCPAGVYTSCLPWHLVHVYEAKCSVWCYIQV